ncbi:hypothetical protein [Paraliomyxa miuraensis]|uniref:hypothetical protein n=1 Tax=Paraliomyxa miuraensis TaxID=376150 RepID=UPI00225A3118|nr:hypothetical protein [Paraliomyxa miuraensis]MCX4243674.1 hypothetical protein [Paraliomyxa miuraensis]
MLLASASKEACQMYATIREQLYAEGWAIGFIEGRAKGMASMLEQLIDMRGLSLTHELRERLAECQDENQLLQWFDRAVTATSLAEIFDVEGILKGMARMLERLFVLRGLSLTDELRERLAECKDESLLQRWFDRAVTATSLTEIFDD